MPITLGPICPTRVPFLPSSRPLCPLTQDPHVPPNLRRYSSNTSCVDGPLFPFAQRPRVG